MKQTLTGVRRRDFCRAYLRTLDPDRAARETGGEDGFLLLENPAVRKRIEQMRGDWNAQITREDALRRLAELAFGRANDAAALALAPPGERPEVGELDLSAVSELKVTDKGVEIKFLDRVRALEALCGLLGGETGGAEAFFQALEDAGGEEASET